MLFRMLKNNNKDNLTGTQKRARVVTKTSMLLNLVTILAIVAGVLSMTYWNGDTRLNEIFNSYNTSTASFLEPVYELFGLNGEVDNTTAGGILLIATGTVGTSMFSTTYGVAKRFFNLDKVLSDRKATKFQNKLKKFEYKSLSKAENKIKKLNNKVIKDQYKNLYKQNKL